jgi:hypothetical protein
MGAKDTTPKKLLLSDFNKQFFWQKPPEGMFEVDIGLQGDKNMTGLPNLEG